MYGKMLKVDLTTERVDEVPIPGEWCSNYIGGEGINDAILWEHYLHVDPKIDALSPDNVFVCGLGPLGATGALGAGAKVKFTFKSPAYNCFGDSVAGGFFGSQLRWAGYDHIVVTGKAKHPVYLQIDDDKVQLLDASKLWGKDAHETDSALRNAFGSSALETAVIGPAGENLVRYASVMVSRERAAARTGAGCVMGSKNLKAIAARGTKGVRIADPAAYFRLNDEAYARMDGSFYWRAFAKEGTTALVRPYFMTGGLTWKNHQYNTVPPEVVEKIDAKVLLENFKTTDASCSAGCACACSGWWRIRGQESPAAAMFAGERGEKPELITNCSCMVWGNDDMAVVLHFQNVCNEYALDMAEIGQCIAFLMELSERGILTERDLTDWAGEPLDMEWGNYQTAFRILEAVSRKQNKLYDILSGGVYKAAQEIERLKGVPVLQYCQYGGKGAPLPEDIRTRATWTTLLATATRGCDHLKALSVIEQSQLVDVSKKYFGGPEGADRGNPFMKGAVAAWEENRTAAVNSMGLCIFNAATFSYNGPDLAPMADAYRAVTGEDPGDLLTAGERIFNLEKAFNSRLGLTRRDDSLCSRWMNEQIPKGCPGEGTKTTDYFESMLDEYYAYRGWDPETGLQTREQLEELGLGEVADVLAKDGVLSSNRPRNRAGTLEKARLGAQRFRSGA